VTARPTHLVLDDGTVFEGIGFGADRAVCGEVVFNTGMAGYVEALTDPSYAGQILVLTYPLVGNYGVPAPRPAGSIAGPYESGRIQVQGLVVQHYVDDYSHHAARRSLGQWLREEQIPAVTGVDTRTLTRRLREHGTMRGWLVRADQPFEEAKVRAESIDMQREVFERVAPSEPVTYGSGDLTILLVDAGAKDNLVRSLLERGVKVIRAPWHARLAPLAECADGVLIGNGPGDPKDLAPLVEQIRGLLAVGTKPILGVCLGNQILALAAGGDTYKLPYGHRGVNQPVQDLLTRRCYVTSQNHGYAVRDDALPPDWEPWFVNTNDGTNEGIRSRARPFSSVQFHPEARPGPTDTGFLFDDFLRLVGAMRAR
jgi:carbamoyl-phosphate synthase small subunit